MSGAAGALSFKISATFLAAHRTVEISSLTMKACYDAAYDATMCSALETYL